VTFFFHLCFSYVLAPELCTTSGAHKSTMGSATDGNEAESEHVKYAHLACSSSTVRAHPCSRLAARHPSLLVAHAAQEHRE